MRLCDGPELRKTVGTEQGKAFRQRVPGRPRLAGDVPHLRTAGRRGVRGGGQPAAIGAADAACGTDRSMRNLAVAAPWCSPSRTSAAGSPSCRPRWTATASSATATAPASCTGCSTGWKREMQHVADAAFDDKGLAWLQENERVPLSRFGDACWLAEYRGSTVFGDSIHGPDFYTPWQEAMTRAESIARHGGVCGSLSHLGAMAACARRAGRHDGPAGPRAYGFRPEPGKWEGGFGGPAGWCHSGIYESLSSFRDMTEDALGDRAAVRASRRLAWLAGYAAGRGDVRSARAPSTGR
ncbi:MAG: hypothetical protein U0736_08225 [Gemmataceae bacterium]